MGQPSYVPFGRTVNATFYLSVKWLEGRIRCVKPEYRELRNWYLLHDNAKPHNHAHYSAVFRKKSNYRTQSSALLARFDATRLFLFPKVKLKMKETFFQDMNAIQATVMRHLRVIPIDEYALSFESLYRRSKAGYTLIVSHDSICLSTISWDYEPITVHFSQYRRFHSSLILWETCPIVLFDVSWKYQSPGENGETRDEKNDWRDGLRNATYTLLISLILPTFVHVLGNLTISV